MRYFRKLTGERLYLSPFRADDIEIYTKWAEWMNDRTVADTYGGHHHLHADSQLALSARRYGGGADHRGDQLLL